VRCRRALDLVASVVRSGGVLQSGTCEAKRQRLREVATESVLALRRRCAGAVRDSGEVQVDGLLDERGIFAGGCLADDMGLGQDLQDPYLCSPVVSRYGETASCDRRLR